MKKSFLLILFFIAICFSFTQIYAQEIEVVRGDSIINGDLGESELVLYAHVINVSSVNQTVFLVRTINNLPANWISSLCFDVNCYPPNQDSAVTSQPLEPGDTIEASVHFYPDLVNPGTAQVQIQLGTTHNPSMRTTINLTASTEPSAVNEHVTAINDFKLIQNYPNPFNPSTTISYSIPKRSEVTLKVYNITGKEIATLVNGEREAGTYNINFDAGKLSSGIYFYEITADNFSAVRKMILLK